MKQNKLSVILFAVPVVLGAIAFPLIHSAKTPPAVDLVTTAGTTTSLMLTTTVTPTKASAAKCAGSTFTLNSTLGYTTLVAATPKVVQSKSQAISYLPSNSKMTFAVPTSTINSGFKYMVGFTILQKKNGKTYTLHTQKYTLTGNTVPVTVTCN